MGPRNDYISASIAAKGRLPLRFLLIRECDLNLRKGPRRAPRSSRCRSEQTPTAKGRSFAHFCQHCCHRFTQLGHRSETLKLKAIAREGEVGES